MNQPVAGTSLQSEDRSTDLRANVVGILSDTANGCIAELGYFPSLLRKFRELEQANNKWREENLRLFEDNRALAQYTRRQEEHIKVVATATPDSATRLALLEEQVKTLSLQNIELKRANEALVAGFSTGCNNPAHQRLFIDYNSQSTHRTAVRKFHHPQQVVQPNANPPKLSYQNIAPSGQDPRQHAPTSQRVPHGYFLGHPPSMPMGAHQQIPVLQNASQLTSPITNLRMVHGTAMISPQQTNDAMPNISRNVPPQTSPAAPVNFAHLPIIRRRDSTQIRPPIVPNAQPYASYRRTSLTIQTSVPHGTSNLLQKSPLDNKQCSPDGTNSPLSPSQSVSISTPRLLLPQQGENQGFLPMTREIYMQYSPTGLTSHEFMSPPDSASLKTPISSNQETLPVQVVSSPCLAFDQLKREREDISSDSLDTGSAKKKVRLGEEDRFAEAAQVQDTPMDDDSDQEIEVDSDGLRSIASCISELMENTMDNPDCYKCRLCEIRYKTGVISDAPKPLIGASQEQLVQHLTTEHADAWETLRRDV